MTRAGALLALVAAASPARACTVCFGASSAGWNAGFTWGIVLLLALPFTLLGALVALVVYHTRKSPRPALPIPK